jgi:uncharacterized damage-inducible protein DinB
MTLNPYATALGERDAVAVIRQTPQRWQALLANLSAEQTEHTPAPGKWSVREILAHVADCEIAFGFRLRQAYAGQPLVQPFDQGEWSRAYSAYSLDQSLATFLTLRAWNITFVEHLTDADKLLPVTHPERGDMQLWTLVETMAGHDLHHLATLEAQPG